MLQTAYTFSDVLERSGRVGKIAESDSDRTPQIYSRKFVQNKKIDLALVDQHRNYLYNCYITVQLLVKLMHYFINVVSSN